MALPSASSNATFFTLQVLPAGFSFRAAPDVTVLAAARAAGVVLPSSCRNGTCRACLCVLTSGRVRYTVAWPGLSAEEKLQGDILPCVAVAESDLTLQVAQARSTTAPP